MTQRQFNVMDLVILPLDCNIQLAKKEAREYPAWNYPETSTLDNQMSAFHLLR